MNLETVISVFAIIISFIALGALIFQSREMSRSTKSNTYNQIVDQNLHLNEMLFSADFSVINPLFNDNSLDKISEEDLTKARIIGTSLIDHYENVYIHHKLDNVPSTVWPGWESYMAKRILQSKLLTEIWKEMKPTMDKDFVSYMDKYTRNQEYKKRASS